MSLKKAYLYLVSIISLVIAVVGAIILIDMALKSWIFTKADRNYYSTDCYSKAPAAVGEAPQPCSAEELAAQEQQEADQQAAQKQRDAAQALAMLIVATPVWYYHWRAARKEA
ncbi:MAG TPA: DUF5671 domain-containing protein [Patescibacteria group bacterium]|nr:DUF5671 domain-containing protein [Patescibacteria group bacterium]